jgi:hypothetical protein
MLYTVCLSLSASIYSIAADKSILPVAQSVDAEIVDSHLDAKGLDKTIELNFSPEKREMLRKALDEYARAVDQDHEQIEARRRKMRESIKVRFFDADIDFDNTIDRQEATDKLPQIARHFSAVDTNQDEVISLDELVSAQDRMIARRKSAENAIEMRKMIGAQKQMKSQSTQAANIAPKSAL